MFFIMAESKLSLMQEEDLFEIIYNYPVNFDYSCKRYKKRDTVTYAWDKITNSLEFLLSSA